ncbi:substrate-binding periplasmic protein [Pseudomonas abieticivorans]|uniref:substrate-binding periplasmic protein n=1 Tax=Pseudomonas abieticivorans TaxID=2931382 RepID=UPI0020BF2B63|nr:transporter substrate-binding domain-containing protein [Pseudomonas sp. PIA16]
MGWPGRWGTFMALGVALVPSLALAVGKCERVVATGSPDAPPYLWRDPADPRHLIGASADLLAQVAAELGLKVEVLYAGKRSQAMDEVRSGRMDLLVDAPMALDDLDSLDFIHPPLVLNDYLVWTQQGSALVYNTVGDLHGHLGAVSARARLTASFESFAQENLSLAHTENLTQAFQQLMLGQVEYVVAGRYAGLAMAQTLGLGKDLVAHETPLDRPGLYVALSHNSACNDPWLRGQLAKKMTELPASAQAQVIVQRNVERWKAQMQQPPGAPKQ